MNHRSFAAIFLIIVACTPAAQRSDSVIDELRAAGLRVEDAGPIEQAFFSVPAHVYRVEGNDLQVYRYASDEAAAADAATVSPNGAIGGAMPMWIAPPHFFRRGNTIAIYLGDNARVLTELERILGRQFAGS